MPSVRSPFVVEHLAKARAAWPTLEWAEDDYVAWLTESLGEELDSGLAALVPGDVLLCWVAARGDPAAHRLFHAHFMPHVSSAVRRFRESDAFTDEVIQRVLMKTLMPRHGEALAPIAGLALRGNVHGLMRVAAVREAVSLRRGDKPAAPVEELDLLVGVEDPELLQLKQLYAQELRTAFVAAVAQLPSRDRQVLRLNLSMGATIDDIARMFQTHRSTAARWLVDAREALAAGTRQHLSAKLGLGEPQLQSLLRLVRTEATRMLESIPPSPDEV